MRRMLIIVPLALALLAGCETDGLFDHGIDVRGSVELGFGLAFLEGEPGRVLYLEVGADKTRGRELLEAEEGEELRWIKGGPDPTSPQRVYVQGGPADERTSDVEEVLYAIDPAAGGAPARYAVGSSFDGLAFSPGGSHAVLYHQSADESAGLYNPNEVAIVDLGLDSTVDATRVVSIGIGGRTIEGVTFVPPLEIDGVTRQLVVFMAEGLIKLVDLRDPASGTVSIKLVTSDDPRYVVPEQVLARAGDGSRDPMLFVRASGSEDVYAISLIPPGTEPLAFSATLNQFEGGPSPSDMLVIEGGDSPLLLVTNDYGAEASVTDVDTSAGFKLELDGVASTALRRTGEAGEEVVLFGANTNWVHFLALEGLAEEQDANLEALLLPDTVNQALVLDQDRLLLTTSYEDGLLLLDLRDRDVTRLTASGGYEWNQAEMYGEVFFLAEPGADRVISMDLTTGHPEALVLDEPVSSFHLFPAAGMGLVIHPAEVGRATVFPLATPSRDFAEVVDGFWLAGFLDDTEVQ